MEALECVHEQNQTLGKVHPNLDSGCLVSLKPFQSSVPRPLLVLSIHRVVDEGHRIIHSLIKDYYQ